MLDFLAVNFAYYVKNFSSYLNVTNLPIFLMLIWVHSLGLFRNRQFLWKLNLDIFVRKKKNLSKSKNIYLLYSLGYLSKNVLKNMHVKHISVKLKRILIERLLEQTNV
jgi:hypothetical protein